MAECFDGDQCPIHYRNDAARITDNDVFIVTYVGDYAVTTVVAPELRDPIVAMAFAVGIVSIPALITVVGYVGEGSIEQSKTDVPDDEYMRFFQRHEVAGAKDAHDVVVSMVKDDLLDLSTFITNEDLYNDGQKLMNNVF